MREIKRLLAMSRLLTVTGFGGCGKTRLALEVARDLTGLYPDGVWLIELAEISNHELVPRRLQAHSRCPSARTTHLPGRSWTLCGTNGCS